MASFYTDVIKSSAQFKSAKRVSAVSLLEPVTRALVAKIIAEARAMGIEVIAYETYRSQARQAELFKRGATQLRKVGVHHYGLACDIVKVVGGEPTWKGDYSFLGHLARANGLVWGGDWGRPDIKPTFVDAVHVQRCTVARQAALFAGKWYPAQDYDPFVDLAPAAAPASPALAQSVLEVAASEAESRRPRRGGVAARGARRSRRGRAAE